VLDRGVEGLVAQLHWEDLVQLLHRKDYRDCGTPSLSENRSITGETRKYNTTGGRTGSELDRAAWRFSQSPWINHSWGVTLYVTARGLTTSPMPDGERTFQIDFDFIDHLLSIVTSDGRKTGFPLRPRSVADFYRTLMQELATLGIHPEFSPMPNEIPYPTRFDLDEANNVSGSAVPLSCCRSWWS
jgi:hypothetical protein